MVVRARGAALDARELREHCRAPAPASRCRSAFSMRQRRRRRGPRRASCSARELHDLRPGGAPRREPRGLGSRRPRLGRRQEQIRSWAAPVSQWMVQAAAPQPGERVLELAAGLGEIGHAGGRAGRADGRRADLRPGRGDARGARERAAELGITNVEFQVLNAEWIDLPLATVDIVLCRWGFMLMADPGGAGREQARAAPRRASGAGDLGRRSRQPVGARCRTGAGRARARGGPAGARASRGRSRWATPASLRGLLEEAGFAEHRDRGGGLCSGHASFDELWESQLDISREFPRRGDLAPRGGDRGDQGRR